MTWTVPMVERMLEEAADTLRLLPLDRPQGFRSCMPEPVRAVCDFADDEEPVPRPVLATPAAIDRLDQVLSWMAWLDGEQARLVWGRACGVPWRQICRSFRLSRHLVWRRWVEALVVIKIRLNQEGVPAPG